MKRYRYRVAWRYKNSGHEGNGGLFDSRAHVQSRVDAANVNPSIRYWVEEVEVAGEDDLTAYDIFYIIIAAIVSVIGIIIINRWW